MKNEGTGQPRVPTPFGRHPGLRLTVTGPGGEAHELEVDGDEARVGRHPDAQVRLPHTAVSLRHARIARDGAGTFVVDEGSTNGTFAGGARLASGARHALRAGDAIAIGPFTVALAARSETAALGTQALARRMVALALGSASDGAALVVAGGPDAGARLPLDGAAGPFTIGRAPACDLVLADPDASREHARVTRDAEGFFIENLGAKNGVLAGGERIAGARRLADGDEIQLGSTRLRLHDPAGAYLRQLAEIADAPATAPLPPPEPVQEAPPAAPPASRALPSVSFEMVLAIAGGVVLVLAATAVILWLR